VPLIKAIESCDDSVELGLTPSGRLRVKSGKFSVMIDCLPNENVPHMTPAGSFAKVDGEQWLKAFEVLFPFIGEDASRPFTNGILLRNASAYATNNVTVIEYWLSEQLPFVVNIPQMAIKEILRIGEPVEYLQLDERSISFHYAQGKWLRTQLLSSEWPDLSKILDRPSQPTEVDERIFEGLNVLMPFAEDSGRVFFDTDVMRTHLDDGFGAAYELSGSTITGCYQAKMLRLLESVATTADFASYPSPCMFFGDRIRGALACMAMPGTYATKEGTQA
jgi:hypothetical protein